jgi:hypothetical protein
LPVDVSPEIPPSNTKATLHKIRPPTQNSSGDYRP